MKCCILIAGTPASGKTTFAAYLADKLSLPVVSKDELKELLYDTVGFQGHSEKVTLSIASTQMLYYFAESIMRTGTAFIMENNFENVQKNDIQTLMQTYRYRPVVVRFGGDVQIIYQRYLERNTQPGRHGGHKTNDGWPPRKSEILLSSPLTMEEFSAGIRDRGIASFSLGHEDIYVDATDFSRLSYEDIVEQVQRAIKSPQLSSGQ